MRFSHHFYYVALVLENFDIIQFFVQQISKAKLQFKLFCQHLWKMSQSLRKISIEVHLFIFFISFALLTLFVSYLMMAASKSQVAAKKFEVYLRRRR